MNQLPLLEENSFDLALEKEELLKKLGKPYQLAYKRTPFECAILRGWYKYIRDVATKTGIPISDIDGIFAAAESYFARNNFDAAYDYYKQAVTRGRERVKAYKANLKAAVDTMYAKLRESIDAGWKEGADMSGFNLPLRDLDTQYKKGDYLAAYNTAASLLDQVAKYREAVRLRLPHARGPAVTGLPPGTTDLIVVDYLLGEGNAWSQEYYASKYIQEKIVAAVKQVDPTAEVLGYRVDPPRVVVFVRGSPIAPLILVIVLVIVVGLMAMGILYMIKGLVGMDAEVAKAQAEAEKARAQFYDNVRKDLAEGRISPDTAKMLLDNYDEEYRETQEIVKKVVGPPVIQTLLMLLGLGIGAMIIFKVWEAVKR
jgi:tetratricopeptide (TPR) repeat protein